MRLLLLTEYFAPHSGGTAVYYYEIVRRLTGFDIMVVTRAHPCGAAFDRQQPFTIVRTPFLRIPKIRMVVEWWAQFLIGLWAVIWHRIDVVHGGQVYPLGLAVFGIHLITGVPYAIYIHGEEVTVAARHSWRRMVIVFILRHAGAIFVNSRFSATQVKALGVAAPRIHIVCPGVDCERFRPTDGSSLRARLGGDGRRVLLSTGRLIPRKGQDTIIRLLPLIRTVSPQIVYWVAGGGSKSERQRLECLAARAGVADSVRILGEVSEGDLPTLYAACDVFVLLNRTMPDGDVEGFGIVFLEASACGKPVIGGRSGGAVEAVKDGQTGFLIPEGDDLAAVAAIVRLLRDRELSKRLGEAGRRRVIRHFSWDRTARCVARVTAKLTQFSEARADTSLEGSKALA